MIYFSLLISQFETLPPPGGTGESTGDRGAFFCKHVIKYLILSDSYLDISESASHSEVVTTNFTAHRVMTEKAIDRLPIKQILKSFFPGLINFRKAPASRDKRGTDYSAALNDFTPLGFDIKLRTTDPRRWGKDDLAIELWSSVEHGITGYRGTETDYILWLYPDTGRALLVPFHPFRKRVIDKRSIITRALKPHVQATRGKAGNIYHSQHAYVPTWLFSDLIKEARFNPIRTFKKSA